MRLDAYLVAARLFKRRTLAKAACEAGAVSMDGRPAKASRPVRTGDVLTIEHPSTRLVVEVAKLPEGPVRRSEARELYTLRARQALGEEVFRPAAQAISELRRKHGNTR